MFAIMLILGILLVIFSPLFGLAVAVPLGGFKGVGLLVFIIGIALISLTLIIHNKREDSKNKKTKEKNSNLTPKLLKRVEKFKNENGFKESEIVELEEDYFWKNNDYLLSICKNDTYIDGLEKADGCYIENIEKGSDVSELELFERKILIDSIAYFQIQGEISTREKISGGGSSIGGAVVGAALAGGVGAIIGSRKKINSETIREDNRFILLVYKKGKKIIKEKLDYDICLDMLEELIPEKEYSYVLSKKS
jgi:hypothetical protein